MPSARTVTVAAAIAAAALAMSGCGGGAGSEPAAGSASVAAPSGRAATSATSTSATATAATSSPAPPTSGASTPATAPGGYIEYAAYSKDPASYAAGRVVLFFHATWCPDCQRTDENLTADPASVPAGLTIVKVDYDTSTDLRRRYGVTRQWTFVSIDAGGQKQKIWTGTDTGAQIADQV